MALEMRLICEKCNKSLPLDGVALICSYECTFCENCANAINFTCPNCQGELLRRPKRK